MSGMAVPSTQQAGVLCTVRVYECTSTQSTVLVAGSADASDDASDDASADASDDSATRGPRV